ncbi:MAG: hypothetical protein R2932_23450 [Caldilineaceae bacterium]
MEPLWGQEEENFVYLPVVTKANQPKSVAGPGSAQIQAAGRFSWDETGMTPPVADEAVPATAADPNEPKTLAPIAGPNRSTIRCTTQTNWQQLAAMSSDALLGVGQ